MKERFVNLLDPAAMKGTLLFVGMPGIGLVGKLAVDSMIESYKAQHVMELYPRDLPPRVAIDKTGIPEFMRIDLYHAYDDKIKRDLLFLVGDIQPQTMDGQYEFGEYVAQLAKKYQVTMLIACAASITMYIQDEPFVHVAASSQEIIESFTKNPRVQVFREGTITGANGLVPTIAARFYGIDSAILLADTTRIIEQIFNVDPKASKSILEVLLNRFDLAIDPAVLDPKVEELNNLLATLKSRAETTENGKDENERTNSFIS